MCDGLWQLMDMQVGVWAGAEELALVWCDVETLSGWLDTQFQQRFVDALVFLPPQVCPHVLLAHVTPLGSHSIATR